MFLAAVVCLASSSALAAPALVLNHSGRLRDGNDQPVTGTANLSFVLHTTSDGANGDGTPWSDAFTNVPLDRNGVYFVALGDTSGSSGSSHTAFTPQMFAGDRWLAITVNGVALSPWLKIGSVPSAAVAGDSEKLAGNAPSRG